MHDILPPAAPDAQPPTPFDAVDLFAGPGGWDQGAKSLGVRTIGLEWDHAACQTAVAAGHPRIRCDVAAYPTAPFVGIRGLIASPPCQAWSMAGNRKGEADRANCHKLADRMAEGDDSLDWTEWEDERSALVCQPVRWVRDLRPEWIALEEVPAVAGLWEHIARIFQGWGYSVWTGDVCAADYGVPQERYRRILMASRVDRVEPPVPTHAENPHADLFGGNAEEWVSMETAIGWGFPEPAATISGGGAETGGAEPFANADYRRRLAEYVLRASNNAHACVRPATKPAPTILFAGASNDVRWYPAGETTPGRPEFAATRSPNSARLTVEEAGVLQSFPADYPWRGTQSKRYQQVGNAVPPRLAAHVLAALTGMAQEVAA